MNALDDSTPFYQKLACVLLSLSILGVILYAGQDILKPLFFSILLSVLLLPVTDFFRRVKFHRFFSILITLILSSILILAVIYFLSRQVFSFMDDFDNIRERLTDLYSSLQQWVNRVFGVTIAMQDEYIHSTEENMDTAKIVGRTFISLTTVLSYAVFLPVYTFLILFYKDLIWKFLIAAFSSRNEEKVREILSESRYVCSSKW